MGLPARHPTDRRAPEHLPTPCLGWRKIWKIFFLESRPDGHKEDLSGEIRMHVAAVVYTIDYQVENLLYSTVPNTEAMMHWCCNLR